MEPGARATLDDSILRSRLRRDFVSPNYVRRPVPRPQTSLLSDVVPRRHPEPTYRTNSQADAQSIVSTQDNTVTQLHPSTSLSSHKSRFSLLAKSTSRVGKHLAQKHKGKNRLQQVMIVLAICIVFAGGYVSLLSFRANHLATVQAAKLTAEANKAASNGSSPAPSSVKPTAKTLASYVVAPNLPRYIMIPKLGIDARVLSVGVNAQGALKTPDSIYDTAWYNESSEPGQQGAMLIDGHVSNWTAQGVFYGIKTLVAGDLIKIERGDGTIFTYGVVRDQVYSSGDVNMQSAITPVIAGQPGLNLITCAGDVIPGTSQLNERIVVYATLVGS